MLKTRSDKVKKIEMIEIPCIVSFNIDEGSAEYLKWINESVDIKIFSNKYFQPSGEMNYHGCRRNNQIVE